jgi:hypothetical protein
MARKRVADPPRKESAGSLPIMQERAVMIAKPWDPWSVAQKIHDLPSELDRAETWSNAPTRAIHSANLDRDDE